jgi:hypothetical protein
MPMPREDAALIGRRTGREPGRAEVKLSTFTWEPGAGWSAGALPEADSPDTLVVALGDAALAENPEPLRELVGAYPSSRVVGCSTSGQIVGASLSDGTLAVAVARFERSQLRAASAPVSSAADSLAAGRSLAEQLDEPSLCAVFVLSEGLGINGSELVRGLNGRLGRSVVVTGGLAGDADRFERTWVLVDGQPRSGFVSAVGFYGDALRVGHGSKGGWDPFGPERLVTRAEGNVLFELDGKSALPLYKTYLGDLAAELPASALLFPLSLRAGRVDERRVVRTILAVDEERGSMTFAGDVPQGHLAQLMMANFDRLVGGAGEAAEECLGGAPSPGEPTLALAVSCVGRRLVLGERTEDEIAATLDVLPAGTQQIGFYSYGELSPHAGDGGACELHNQTMTLTTLGER